MNEKPNGCANPWYDTLSACMKLPKKYTCGDCLHFERCKEIIDRKSNSKECDWFPIRFVRANKESINVFEENPIELEIATGSMHGKVVVGFSESVRWFALSPADAREFSKNILELAGEAELQEN